ncbi:hypothetical protein ACJQWK_04892 [Exserohilum turcicum]|uniref:Uncharacterized protein n=1 Tax=Exserohilum turcicum (strain 28A) TaxID=671987 RepID=R0K399_EXST2|nr:uncharacterized protein SETTUDRAFT_156522 [Exserohilum turcica Et28A]EOA82857.1 hypothetical protein SETTUDRAFT_156522 [Exserohilum turcica Et28A]
MPRNGDGSSDNGPIETGQHAIHGASGDASMEHTKKVAPMPEPEKGEGIQGMSASGGGEAPRKGHTGQGRPATDSNKPAPVDQATK